ncbi:uncharacterized protein LOC125478117 [Pyrus x bretschneideri]|uniref:uncharacterized protein LOC125478117 n=1 Tax=Pyrus x bretschneideri TaxID=225117 RepID=UPI00202F9633|nr:uncharacterized protein LOC125478117 [Pyrus x bretschneideri]
MVKKRVEAKERERLWGRRWQRIQLRKLWPKKSANRKGLFYHCNYCTRSISDELSSNTSTLSPDSVLHKPKHSTILSRKEAKEIGNLKWIYSKEEPQKKVERRRKRKKKSESKSLTDLQFEELKGFMDLGFVFSEEDKDSNLVSIIVKFRADEMAKANEFIRKQWQRDWEAARLSLIEVETKCGD